MVDTVRLVTDGAFVGETDSVFDVANGGVGYGKISSEAPPSVARTLSSVADGIKAGTIRPPRK